MNTSASIVLNVLGNEKALRALFVELEEAARDAEGVILDSVAISVFKKRV